MSLPDARPPTGPETWLDQLTGDPRIAVPVARLRARIAESRRRMREEPDAGYSTETVLVTALLVALALVVVAILAAKIIEKANGITLG